MELSRMIPSRKETIVFYAIKKDFSTFGPAWRDVRKNLHDPLDKCDWCHTPFKDGDLIALGFCKKSRNKILCQSCAAIASLYPQPGESAGEKEGA